MPDNRTKHVGTSFCIGEQIIGIDKSGFLVRGVISFMETVGQMVARLCRRRRCCIAYPVQDSERYGMVEFDGIIRCNKSNKTNTSKANYAASGLCFYDISVVEIVKKTFSLRLVVNTKLAMSIKNI